MKIKGKNDETIKFNQYCNGIFKLARMIPENDEDWEQVVTWAEALVQMYPENEAKCKLVSSIISEIEKEVKHGI